MLEEAEAARSQQLCLQRSTEFSPLKANPMMRSDTRAGSGQHGTHACGASVASALQLHTRCAKAVTCKRDNKLRRR